MSEFKKLEGASCLLINKHGSYRACDLYEYNGLVYAKSGRDFVRLMSYNYTSHSTWPRYRELSPGSHKIERDTLGRMCVDGGTSANVAKLREVGEKLRA